MRANVLMTIVMIDKIVQWYFTTDNEPDGIENATSNTPGHGRGEYRGLHCKCIVGCIFNSVWLIMKYPVHHMLLMVKSKKIIFWYRKIKIFIFHLGKCSESRLLFANLGSKRNI
jgi:hypothetical protein